MTPEEIKQQPPVEGSAENHGQLSICFWLKEIALQLSVVNETQAKWDARQQAARTQSEFDEHGRRK